MSVQPYDLHPSVASPEPTDLAGMVAEATLRARLQELATLPVDQVPRTVPIPTALAREIVAELDELRANASTPDPAVEALQLRIAQLEEELDAGTVRAEGTTPGPRPGAIAWGR